jgi:hypothetical protein
MSEQLLPNIDEFALTVARDIWAIGNRISADECQRKAQIQVRITEALESWNRRTPPAQALPEGFVLEVVRTADQLSLTVTSPKGASTTYHEYAGNSGYEVLKCFEAELAAAPAAVVEPVAWRFRSHDKADWRYRSYDPTPDVLALGWEAQPLYAAPPAAPQLLHDCDADDPSGITCPACVARRSAPQQGEAEPIQRVIMQHCSSIMSMDQCRNLGNELAKLLCCIEVDGVRYGPHMIRQMRDELSAAPTDDESRACQHSRRSQERNLDNTPKGSWICLDCGKDLTIGDESRAAFERWVVSVDSSEDAISRWPIKGDDGGGYKYERTNRYWSAWQACTRTMQADIAKWRALAESNAQLAEIAQARANRERALARPVGAVANSTDLLRTALGLLRNSYQSGAARSAADAKAIQDIEAFLTGRPAADQVAVPRSLLAEMLAALDRDERIMPDSDYHGELRALLAARPTFDQLTVPSELLDSIYKFTKVYSGARVDKINKKLAELLAQGGE